MRTRLLVLLLIGAATVAALATTARTEDEEGGAEGDAWMALGTPGPEHAWLGGFVGTWTVEARFWQGPGDPMTSEGKASIHSIWDGRYVVMDYEGTFEGQPFQGKGTWAYNNGAKRYEGSWIDSFSTALATSTGERAGDTLTMKGSMYTPQGLIQGRDVVKREGPDRWTMTSYWSMPQGEAKVMELVYTRAQ